MKEPIKVVNWFMRPTANTQLAIQFASNGPWNDTCWNSYRMGELPKLSLSEIDPVKRHERYCVMQTLIHNESGMVIPCFVNLTDGIVGNLMGATNVPIEPVGACDSGRRMSGSPDCS